MKVLYVDDDPAARRFVQKGLERQSFVVDVAATVEQGTDLARSGDYDALILDVMLPDGDGLGLLRSIRGGGNDVPALFLSSRGEVGDRLRGFETGADDYLPKPFALSELAVRIRAIARRRANVPLGDVLRLHDLVLDRRTRSVERGGTPIDLPPKQYAILELLMRNGGKVVAREAILEKVWNHGTEPRSNALTVQIAALRKLVDDGFDADLVHTKPGVGYLMELRR